MVCLKTMGFLIFKDTISDWDLSDSSIRGTGLHSVYSQNPQSRQNSMFQKGQTRSVKNPLARDSYPVPPMRADSYLPKAAHTAEIGISEHGRHEVRTSRQFTFHSLIQKFGIEKQYLLKTPNPAFPNAFTRTPSRAASNCPDRQCPVPPHRRA